MEHNYKIGRIIIAVVGCMFIASCNKFIDITPRGYKLLTTVGDYDLWLNDHGLWGSSTMLNVLNVLGDYVDMPVISNPPTTESELFYTWAPQPSSGASLWGMHYARISSYNSVLNGIDDATGGSLEQKRNIKAEALLGRALEYFYLINEYGKAYDPATATTDLGVQLIVSDDVAQEVPPRASVQDVYDFILTDLQAAIPNLPVDNSRNRFRGSQAAGHSILARVYLYMRDYEKARHHAELALENNDNLRMINYNLIGSVSALPALAIRQDAIFARGDQVSAVPTQAFLRAFSIRDARLRYFYTPLSDMNFNQRGVTRFAMTLTAGNSGTSVQEMKLIIAEAAARNNELELALEHVNDIRKNRIPGVFLQPYDSEDKDFVWRMVMLERQFELPFTGLRWFDMRRLDAEGNMQTVERLDAQGNVIASLLPNSTKYTLQVPEYVMQYNPGMSQNP